MNRKMLIKLVIDFVMTILMLVEMAYTFTGNIVHELVGISLFILFIIHNILNRRWYQTIFRGKMNVRRILNITINLLLLVIMIVLIISAVPISRTIFAFIHIKNDGLTARQIHTLAAYWGLIIMAIHIGMHWEMIMGVVRKMIGITERSRIRIIVLQIFAVIIVVHGVQASFYRDMGSKLILYSTFDIFNSDESFIKLFSDYLSIVAMYICGVYYAIKIAPKGKKTKYIK